jgi:hypothetical protein
MQHESNAKSHNDIGEVIRRADELAASARGDLGANQRAAHGGQETDYDFRLPPDLAEADRVRAADDVDLIHRQQDAAETQRTAAQALRETAERLRGTAHELDRTGDAVRDNRDDLDALRQNGDEIRDQVAQAREQVRQTRVPDADASGQSEAESIP